VSLAYDGSTLSIKLTDTVTHATFVTNSSVNIPGILGTNTAYVGLSGADGGISSTQVVTNFQFASLTSLSNQASGANAIGLSWPNAAGGLVLQQTPAFGSGWTTVPAPVLLDSNANNQVQLPAQPDSGFFRLATP
jgi:hypothetical protein